MKRYYLKMVLEFLEKHESQYPFIGSNENEERTKGFALLLFIIDFRVGMRMLGGEFPANVYNGGFRADINRDIPINCFK
jgi:hypothetical protein